MPAFESLNNDALQATIMTWSGMPDPNNKRPKGATPQEVSFLNKLLASQQRIHMMPRMPVTIVNINPYKLMVLHPLFDGLTVNANKPGEKYSALVIRDVKYQVDTGIDRNHSPLEFWPIQLAAEFSTQYREKGGVFHFNGDLEKNPELANTDEFRRLYSQAEGQLIGYCRQLKQTADNEWNTPNRSGARNIHPTHRIAARILFERKLLSKLPEWMEGNVDLADVTEDCPVCQAHTKKNQLVCMCSWVLNPFDAFKKGAIDEYHASLERLTRAQVKELGVTAFVAETVDERPERIAAGRVKPLAQFEVQQQTALDKETGKSKGK